jgi:predicted phage tail protein
MSHLTIKLLGSLGRRFGQTHQLEATRLNEGISFLRYQFDEFEQCILELDRLGIRFSVVVQTAISNLLIDDPSGLRLAITQDTTLIITTVPAAAGDFGKFLLGVGLLAVSAFLPGSIGILGATISSSTIGLYGAGLVLGSVINWLSPKPVETKASVISPTISNNGNGNSIPFGYGRRFVNPQVISGGSRIIDLSTNVGGGGFYVGPIYFPAGTGYIAARSIARLQVVDALCEGKIKGLTNGDRSIWINGVPIRNLDNNFAYQGIVNIGVGLGEQGQLAFPSPWDKVLGETTVNQKLTQSIGPATRRINNSRATNIDGIRVRLYWDRCLNTNDTAAQTGHRISIKEGNGAFQIRWEDTLNIKSSSSFEREVYLSVNQADYYEVKVERIITDDDTAANTRFSTAFWKSYTTVLNSKLTYPNTAKVGLEIDLEKFGSSDLQRVYQVDLLEILIPNNATVRADGSLFYTGIWVGIFQRAWTSDPAWALYDMLINDRYGCGVDASRLDKYAFQRCSAYCGALVPDGYGGTEPRFTLNCLISDRDSAYNLIQKLCGVFNAIAYYDAINLTPVVDRPLPVTHQFTNANATFSYAGTAYRNRRNRAVVSYTRADTPNSTDFEIYEDKADILKRGVEELRIDATSTCTSRGQAYRTAKWAIYSEQTQKESITIQTGLDGALVRPGDIIQVGDRDRAGLRRWGRIKSATLNTITLDNPVTLGAGTYKISCTLPDATLVERTISSIAGNVVTLTTNFLNQPEPQASWLIAGGDLQPTLYRVISRAEPETHRFEILALLHEPNKYSEIENGINLVEPIRAVTIPSPPLPPQNLILTPYLGINISIGVAWDAPTPSLYTMGYQTEYRRIGDAPVTTNTTTPAYLITMATYGEYEVRIRSIDTTGAYSGWVVANIDIVVPAYFATCYLGDIAQGWFASITNPVPDTLIATNFSSTEIIQPEPQVTFGSTERIVILNP